MSLRRHSFFVTKLYSFSSLDEAYPGFMRIRTTKSQSSSAYSNCSGLVAGISAIPACIPAFLISVSFFVICLSVSTWKHILCAPASIISFIKKSFSTAIMWTSKSISHFFRSCFTISTPMGILGLKYPSSISTCSIRQPASCKFLALSARLVRSVHIREGDISSTWEGPRTVMYSIQLPLLFQICVQPEHYVRC